MERSRRLRRIRLAVTAALALTAIAAITVPAVVAAPLPTPPNPEPAPRPAFVVRNDVPADALAVGPVAGALGGIVVSTPSTLLSGPAQQSLTEFAPDTVYIAGGEAAISADVEDAIVALGSWDVERLAGAGRDETAYLIGKVLEDLGIGRPVVTGQGDGTQVVGDAYVGGDVHAQDLVVPDEWVQSAALNGVDVAGDTVALTGAYDTILSDTVQLPPLPDPCGEFFFPRYQVKVDVDGTFRNQSGAQRLARFGIAVDDNDVQEASKVYVASDGDVGHDYDDFGTHTVLDLAPGTRTIELQGMANATDVLVLGARLTVEVIDARCTLPLLAP